MATSTNLIEDGIATLMRGSKTLFQARRTLDVLRQPAKASIFRPEPSKFIASAAVGVIPSQSRLLDLQKKQCDIFGTTYNPDRLRLGNKVLRQRLKGPILSAYYPRKAVTIADLNKEFARYDLETYNEEEEDRLEGLQIAKLRGKGAPKKKRTADTMKKGGKKKR